MIIKELEELVKRSLEIQKNQAQSIEIGRTVNFSFGDYSTNLALILAKNNQNNSNPLDLAQKIIDNLPTNNILEKAEVAGPGFINFWLSHDYLLTSLKNHLDPESVLKGKTFIIEFAHPNTHKSFHIGHLRNIITGEAISRIFEACGAKIIRANYQGDVGLHIAKALWGIKQRKFLSDEIDLKEKIGVLSEAYAQGNQAYEDGSAKAEIEKINLEIYNQSNPEISKLYLETRQWSLAYFDLIYKRLEVKFDRFYFESEVAATGKEIVEAALAKEIFIKSQGAVIYPGSQFGLHDRVFITTAGTSTYEAKDLGLAQLQFQEYQPDQIYHVVAPEQSGYFQVLFSALEKVIPQTKDKEKHLAYGWVRLKEGKMSSRTGKVVLGEWLLDEIKKQIIEKYHIQDQTAEALTQGAIKYSFLKVTLFQEIAFDINQSISLSGNSGLYLQYTVARIFGLFRKAGIDPEIFKVSLALSQDNWLPYEVILIRQMIHYQETILKSAQTTMPHYLCDFLYQLAELFNLYYDSTRILDDDQTSQNHRLSLSLSVAKLLQAGLYLLGIKSPEKL